MPAATILVFGLIVGMFVVFAAGLMWADRQTRDLHTRRD